MPRENQSANPGAAPSGRTSTANGRSPSIKAPQSPQLKIHPQPKNKSQKPGVFFHSKKVTAKHHTLTTNHHVLHHKKPSPNTKFFQNTPQKHP
jgi:hypothetical protein